MDQELLARLLDKAAQYFPEDDPDAMEIYYAARAELDLERGYR